MFARRAQASAIVRNRSRRVGHAGEPTESKIVAKRRTVVTFYVSHYKSVNSHREPGGSWESQSCRHFWTRLASSHLKSVDSHRDPGGSWSRKPELSSLLDWPRWVFASQKCQQSQGSGGSWSRNPEERGERGGEGREEKRGERDDPGPTSPKWFRPWGVIIVACTCHVSACGFVAPRGPLVLWSPWLRGSWLLGFSALVGLASQDSNNFISRIAT